MVMMTVKELEDQLDYKQKKGKGRTIAALFLAQYLQFISEFTPVFTKIKKIIWMFIPVMMVAFMMILSLIHLCLTRGMTLMEYDTLLENVLLYGGLFLLIPAFLFGMAIIILLIMRLSYNFVTDKLNMFSPMGILISLHESMITKLVWRDKHTLAVYISKFMPLTYEIVRNMSIADRGGSSYRDYLTVLEQHPDCIFGKYGNAAELYFQFHGMTEYEMFYDPVVDGENERRAQEQIRQEQEFREFRQAQREFQQFQRQFQQNFSGSNGTGSSAGTSGGDPDIGNPFGKCKTKDDVAVVFRNLSKIYHPDASTGSEALFKKLQQMKEEAEQRVS